MALEFHHEVAVANTLGRIENSMSLLESVAMEGMNLCNPLPNHHTLYDSANYPTKPSDRYQHRPITIKAIGGGVLQPQSQYLCNSNNNSRSASPHNQHPSGGNNNNAPHVRRARESSRSAPGVARNRSSSNNRSGTPVWDRLVKESIARDAELAKRRNAAEAFRIMNEVDNCTFKPTTNNNSMAPATKEGETYDRLYNDAQRKEKKRLEVLKTIEAKREKERENNMKVRRSSEDHTNAGKFWDRLYVKPEKAAQRAEAAQKRPANAKPAKKISPEAILRLYNTAADKESRRQQLVKRFEEEREGKLQRSIVTDRRHSIHHHQPPAIEVSTNNGKRVPSPPRSTKAVNQTAATSAAPQQSQYYTVAQPAVPHVARPVPQCPVPATSSNHSNHVAAHIDQLKATSSDYEEPSFNPETDDEPPKATSNSPDLQQIMAAENSDDFEANEKAADARANAATPPPRAAIASMDDDDDDFDLLTPIDAANPAPPANQPTHTLPKLNLDKALLGTAHN